MGFSNFCRKTFIASVPFNVFQNLQRTYSWMKYYNNELDISNKGAKKDEKILEELLQDVRKHINGSLTIIEIISEEPKRARDV
ncbi:MAG TPA: hypothetical protein VH415_10890 [Nitrososphaeraceae archaeon]